MNNTIRIEIGEKEWKEYPKKKRERIKKLLESRYGYNIKSIVMVEEEDEE